MFVDPRHNLVLPLKLDHVFAHQDRDRAATQDVKDVSADIDLFKGRSFFASDDDQVDLFLFGEL
jgi:hypothetical protein